ncbi:MAG: hypothetical protein NVV70_06020 [Cellulomonas sp.]|nr:MULTISPECIES: hypothetical protein [Cellulomonas]MCR6647704.1 hypothetical protein [Cellulomonas sp.]MCR6703694.1 hypothetical protein [Cellulomonas sp.]
MWVWMMSVMVVVALMASLVATIRGDGRTARPVVRDWAEGTSLEVPRSTSVSASVRMKP